MSTRRPIATYHEHPDWFRPLFAELERRDPPYIRWKRRVAQLRSGESPHTVVAGIQSRFALGVASG